MKEKLMHWHDKYYKTLLLIPIVLLFISFIYLGIFYNKTGDFFGKDISLTGGTSVTIYAAINLDQLEIDLVTKLEDISTREIYDVITQEQKAVIIQTKSDSEITKNVLEDYLGYELNEENSSFEFTGSALSESFYHQLILALIVAFIFMGIVVFILFRTFVPSIAVIISALADIIMALTFVDILGIKMSTAGVVALLMLIGYSVDTDILLTTRVLKREEGSINSRIYGAFKTGITMTLTSLLSLALALIIISSFSVILSQIFTILVIGLFFDILNTWITNVSIIKWYVKRKENK